MCHWARTWSISIGIGLLLWSFGTVARAADPLGAYDGLGHHAGQIINVQPPSLSHGLLSPAVALPASWVGHPLSLAQLSWLALRNNPSTHAAWAQLQTQAALLGQARSAWWPTVNLTIPLERRRTTTAAGYALPQQQTMSPNLSLSFLIWDFGHRSAQIRQAQDNLHASEFTQNETVQSVLLGVQEAYYALLGEQALLRAYQASLAQSQEALLSAEALHRAGRATVSDLYQTRAALALAQANLSMARQTLNSDEGTLAIAAGLPLGSHVELTPLDVAAPMLLAPSVQKYMKLALTENPELQSAEYQVSAAREGLSAAQSSDLPELSFGANQGWYSQQGFGPIRQYSLGITLTIPLFTGFRHTYQVNEARSQLSEAQASLESTVNNTQLTVWKAFYAFRSARLALPSARAQEENAAKALDAVQAQYRVGLATIQDLLAAQSVFTSARVSVVQDAINSYLALASLSKAVGLLRPTGLRIP